MNYIKYLLEHNEEIDVYKNKQEIFLSRQFYDKTKNGKEQIIKS